ncbi:hypothetical protein [Aquipuribacter nitratireducens]|uniref:Uncharacterized protein n=1 Tax=Aquipuribacter nitratireducens TaxID=650104 RepID=A0ABW0GQ90_9MICO
MISARSSAPALVLPLALVLGAGLVGPAAASTDSTRADSSDASQYGETGLVLRSVQPSPGTARFAATSATVAISSCFVYDQLGFAELYGTVTADAASATVFDITITGGVLNDQAQIIADAGETIAFSARDFAGDLGITVSSGGAVLAQAARNVPDCTPAPSQADFGADEIVRWDGFGSGEVVSTLTDGNTEIYDFLQEVPGNETGTAVLVPIEFDGVPGEELMSYDPLTGRQSFYDWDPDFGFSLVSTREWSKGWDVIEPIQLDADLGSELVVYNSVTGRQVLINLFGNGTTGTFSDRQWSKGWDVVEPIELDGDRASELVVYNSVTGRQVFVNLFANGSTGTFSDRQWSKGWDTVEPVELQTDIMSELLVYNSATGRQVLVNLFPNGTTGTFSDRQWSTGWDVVTALESDRTPLSELAIYNSSTGRHVLIDLKVGGGTGTYLDTYWGRYWADAVRVNLEGD